MGIDVLEKVWERMRTVVDFYKERKSFVEGTIIDEDEIKLVMVVVVNDAVKAGVRKNDGSTDPPVNETGPVIAVAVSKKIYEYLATSPLLLNE